MGPTWDVSSSVYADLNAWQFVWNDEVVGSIPTSFTMFNHLL